MKVLHFYGTAVLARSAKEWHSAEFAKHGVSFIHEPLPVQTIMRKGLTENIGELVSHVNEEGYDWVFFGWEMSDVFEAYWSHPDRKSKVLIYLQEQPQRLPDLKRLRPFCDLLITSSPIFQDGTDGYIPVPVHTPYIEEEILPWCKKKNRILISGSHRACRYEVFKRLLDSQPFRWPVYFMPSGKEGDEKKKEEYAALARDYHSFVAAIPKDHGDYIPNLISSLNESKVFIDCSFNPYPSLNLSQGNASFNSVIAALKGYKGGYMPERVLDACYMGNACFVLKNPAIEYCLGQNAVHYTSYKDLVEKVSTALDNEEQLKESAASVQSLSQAFTAEEVFKQLADIFKTGKHTNKYVDRRNNG